MVPMASTDFYQNVFDKHPNKTSFLCMEVYLSGDKIRLLPSRYFIIRVLFRDGAGLGGVKLSG